MIQDKRIKDSSWIGKGTAILFRGMTTHQQEMNDLLLGVYHVC